MANTDDGDDHAGVDLEQGEDWNPTQVHSLFYAASWEQDLCAECLLIAALPLHLAIFGDIYLRKSRHYHHCRRDYDRDPICNRATAVHAYAPQERHPGSAAAAVLSYFAGLPEMPLAGFYRQAWMPSSSLSSSPRMRIVTHPAGGEEGVEEQQLAAADGGTAAEGASGATQGTMRAELIGHYPPCMTDIYLHIDARMADYIRTHPYRPRGVAVRDPCQYWALLCFSYSSYAVARWMSCCDDGDGDDDMMIRWYENDIYGYV
eukprot:COSAG05_NODE_1787_length_4092_cov_1.788380_5_plen_261_part_00